MPRRERPLSTLLMAATLVVAEVAAYDMVMSVYEATALPASDAIMNITSPSVCGCRVGCLTVGFCTAVTACKGQEGVTCMMTNMTQPEDAFVSHESAVSFAKGRTTAAPGTYFVSTAVSNDGSMTNHYCTQEGGMPASISDARSLAALKASDAEDGTTDINAAGIWVFVKNDDAGDKVFFNNQKVSSSTSGATLDLSAVGECLRLRTKDVLASVNCADQVERVAFACFK